MNVDRNADRNRPNRDRIGLSDGGHAGPKDRKTENRSETEVSVRSGPFGLGPAALDGTESRTPEERFLKLLADGESVRSACRVAGLARSVLYLRRRSDPEFAAAWDQAIESRPHHVAEAIHEEALEGTPIFDAEGREIGRRRNTRLLERLGEKYGLLPSSRPQIGVAIQNNAQQSQDSGLTEAQRRRLDELLGGHQQAALDVIEAEVVESTATPDDSVDDLL